MPTVDLDLWMLGGNVDEHNNVDAVVETSAMVARSWCSFMGSF
jgi:hypothetical protein